MLAPTCIWMNFKKWVFVYYQTVSVFCGTYPFIVVKAIDSNSESIANHCSKIWVGVGGGGGGGQDKPAGVGCPRPVIEGILSD